MIFLYNILQIILLLFFWPLIILTIPAKRKYRKSIPVRLGWGLQQTLGSLMPGKKIIWIHALSVGEVTSALPLVCRIRETMDMQIVFSTTTRTGTELAEKTIIPHVDRLIPYPLDLLPVVRHFINMIRPDLFILVETDFWPNMLASLANRNIPAILVNGRISQKSATSYMRFRYFFRPLFSSFSALCMQTARDCDNMINLGIPENLIFNLGNLKYDLPPVLSKPTDATRQSSRIRIIAGSTHPGEETILLSAFKRLLELRDDIALVIAPRDATRGKEIQQLADYLGFTAFCRSEKLHDPLPQLFILDTIGELADYYRSCDIAFVGGSMVDQGGHNPIEPAIAGVPILFGPHMEDFSEVAEDLLAAGGAFQVSDIETLYKLFKKLIDNPDFREDAGSAASAYIMQRQGVTEKHLELIRKFL
jgi:3-deoxy-D-manno-octulosonic-acid transferase